MNEKIHEISKKCHYMSDRSLEILSEQAGEEKLEDIGWAGGLLIMTGAYILIKKSK